MRPGPFTAVLLSLLLACGGTPHAVRPRVDPAEAALAAARYELRILSPSTAQPVQVDEVGFQKAARELARHVRPSARPMEAAWRLFELEREVEFLANVQDGRITRIAPLGPALPSGSEQELTRQYLDWCEATRGGGDCLGLLADGPTVRGEDRYTLALAIALGGVLDETGSALRDMADPKAVLQMVLWAMAGYLMLWLIPELAVSKLLATTLTVVLIGSTGWRGCWSARLEGASLRRS